MIILDRPFLNVDVIIYFLSRVIFFQCMECVVVDAESSMRVTHVAASMNYTKYTTCGLGRSSRCVGYTLSGKVSVVISLFLHW
jgi:hypothetical protein